MGARFRIVFYRTLDHRCQACDYARSMDVNHRVKATWLWRQLAEHGPGLPEDYGKRLRDDVWELRVIIQHHQHRFLYCFYGDVVVVTNAFLKKTWDVPDIEIDRAREAMDEWLSRRSRGDV